MKFLTTWLLALTLALSWGCSDDEATSPTPTDAGSGDVADDATTAADAGDTSVPDASAGCVYQTECGPDEICFESACEPAPECGNINAWAPCVRTIQESFGDEFAKRASCRDEYCQINCWRDDECPDGQLCTDYGQCAEFTGDLTGEAPGGDTRAPLQAGISNVVFDIPIGVSAAGFGSRNDVSTNQYAEQLYPTAGMMHALYARAIALNNGERELLLVRLPIIFPSYQLHEAVARALQEETGRNWRDSLIISATHTHSGPGRFWALPEQAAIPVGILGTDTYAHPIYEMVRDTAIDAALAALDDYQPSKLGWSIVEAYDTDDMVASDRWGATPPFDDNRLLMIRIDDMNDVPRAALVSFGTHGTFFEETYLTGDAPGGIERGLEAKLGETYERYIPTLFFSQNGGSMSPRGDRFGHDKTQKMEAHGAQFADRVFDDFQAIETETDITLNAASHSFQIDYDALGYEAGEWDSGFANTVDSTNWHGGLNCGLDADDDYATYYQPLDYQCLSVHLVSQNRPVTIFTKSLITAIQIDDLYLVTMPGENSMEVGYQVVRAVNEELGVDWRDLFIWGYAQDHQLYFTPTNLRGELPPFPGISTPMAMDDYPDFAFSHLQGGYEPSLSVWGPKMGDFMVERAVEAARLLIDGEAPPNADQKILPSQFTPFATQEFMVTDTPDARIGNIVSDMPETVERLTPYEFVFIGGHPGAEAPMAPRVSLIDVESGMPVLLDSRAPYTNYEPAMITRVRETDEDLHEWVIYWEELEDFPAGTYRFDVEGHYHSNGTRTEYTTSSREFTVTTGSHVSVDASRNGLAISGTLSYPAPSPLVFDRPREDPARVAGNFRMRHPYVATGLAYPVEPNEDITASGIEIRILGNNGVRETLSGTDVTLRTEERNVQGRMIPVTVFEATASNGPITGVEIDVVDSHGNTGTYSM